MSNDLKKVEKNPYLYNGESTILKNQDIDETISEVGTLSLMLGFLSSVITSYFSINILLNLIKKQQFHYFTPYCILLGFLLIYTSLF